MSHKLFTRNGKLYHDIRFRDAQGNAQRHKQRASSDDRKAANAEGARIETKLINDAHHGKRAGADKTLAQAIESYSTFEERHVNTEMRLDRIGRALVAMGKGNIKLAEIDQSLMDEMSRKMFAKDAKASSKRAALYAPITAVLNHAHKRGWCPRPDFDLPRIEATETLPFTPEEAFALVQAAHPHHRPLLVFMFCTGCRKGEALFLDWRNVDLDGGTVTFLETMTKTGKRRTAELPPAAITALRQLGPKDSGPVFTTSWGRPFEPCKDGGGRQLLDTFSAACEKAGLGDRGFHPHCTRHSWASWHYCVHKDILLLKRDGGWATLSMVERYAHLMPQKHRAAILRFWGLETALQAVA